MKREDIQYAFNTAKLQKGDILLINDYEESLRKKMGGAKYTHAALYMGGCVYYGSKWIWRYNESHFFIWIYQ